MNRLFEAMLDGLVRRSRWQGSRLARWSPAENVVQKDGNLVILAELPGVKPEDVEITLEDNMLAISGKRQAERKEDGDGYHVGECRYGSFRRGMVCPPVSTRRRATRASETGSWWSPSRASRLRKSPSALRSQLTVWGGRRSRLRC